MGLSKIRVSDLDLMILEFISDMRLVSAEIIGERFFKGKGERYPKKRLKDFVDHDLLFSVLGWGGKKFNYLITDAGTKLLQRRGFDVVTRPMKGIDLKNYEHDKVLNKIRVKLENREMVDSWVSERKIRGRMIYLKVSEKEKIIPDAYCHSLSKDTDLIIEFENSRKSNERIKKLLKTYQLYFVSSCSKNEKVLFFFINSGLLASYKQIYNENKLSFPVQFIEVGDLDIEKDSQPYRRFDHV